MIHELKITREYFEMHIEGKPFEIRKNDRDFKKGDYIKLEEVIYYKVANERKHKYTGRHSTVEITDIFQNLPGLKPDYVILSLI